MLVQVFAPDEGEQSAIIRSSVGNFVSDEHPTDAALTLAETFRLNNGLDAIGVHLEDGAEWDQAWGELVDQKGLGLL